LRKIKEEACGSAARIKPLKNMIVEYVESVNATSKEKLEQRSSECLESTEIK
jgi:hypothetical protein